MKRENGKEEGGLRWTRKGSIKRGKRGKGGRMKRKSVYISRSWLKGKGKRELIRDR